MTRFVPAVVMIAALMMFGDVRAQGLSSMPGFGGGDGFSGPVNCTVKPIQIVELSSQIRGIVAKVYVRPGQHVRRGDAILGLDTEIALSEMGLSKARSEADAMLKAAIIKKQSLTKKEARLAKALVSKAVSQSDYDDVALQLALASNDILREKQALNVARLDFLKSKLLVEKSQIDSPVDGVIGEDLVDPGENVSDRPLATIFVNKPLLVEAFVPFAMLPTYAKQTSFSIQIDGDDQGPVPVNLDHISQMADLTSNTVSMYFTLENAKILPGSKCVLLPPSN